jgi:hypothetical protein
MPSTSGVPPSRPQPPSTLGGSMKIEAPREIHLARSLCQEITGTRVGPRCKAYQMDKKTKVMTEAMTYVVARGDHALRSER